MSQIHVPSTFGLKTACFAVRDLINLDGWLQLFKNNVALTNDSLLTDFLPCDFGGYAPISLAGKCGPCAKLQSGVVQFTTPVQTFPAFGAPFNDVYGAFVQVGADWVAAIKFPFPIFSGTGNEIPVALQWQDWALNLFLP